ncbi:MAG: FKBP-type peptidyl-prolyl cis-trans isomerase [Breznakibacter sp.]
MKAKFSVALTAALVLSLSSCSQIPSGKPKLKNQVDSVSYALGYLEASQYAQQFSNQGFPLDTLDQKAFAKAFAKSKLRDKYIEMRKGQFDTIDTKVFMNAFLGTLAKGGKNGVFDEMSADVVLRTKFNQVREKKDSLAHIESKANLEAGEKFLAENKTKEGVVTTESGLQYQIIKEGNGPKPGLTDQVKCHYHGTLLDGTVFDSSLERKEPATFYVNGVIKGWTEALQMMPAGSKWKLFVPAGLAYGDRAAGEKIKPNSTLVFEVELIEIVKK